MTERNFEMRNTWSFLALVAFAAVNLPGCSKVDPKLYDTDGPVADGDMLIESSIGDAKSLNPPLVSEVTGGDIASLVFNGLARYDEKLELVPALATRWTVSPDGKVITYDLRKGVKFHDGVEFTSADVIFTYRAYTDPKVNTPHGADYRDITSIKALGPYRVEVTYGKPFAPALSNFGSILPKHRLEGKDLNKDDFNRAPIGTGPYKFVEWKTDQRIVLEANPDHWEGKPHIGRFVLRIIPDQSSEFLSLLKGEIDAMGAWTNGGMTPEQFSKQSDKPKFSKYYRKFKTDQLAYTYIGWNMDRPMFKDKKVRRALTMGLDRQVIVDNVLYGLGTVCTGPFASASWAYNHEVKALPYDPKGAKALLEEAGWKDTDGDGLLDKDLKGDGKRVPFKFTLITNQGNVSRERIATIAQEQWKSIGVGVEIKVLEWTTFLTQFVNKGEFDGMLLGWSLTPDPDSYAIWHSSQTGEHQYNRVKYKNLEVDRLLEAGVRTLDQKKRRSIYHRLHEIIAEDQPYTFLYVPNSLPALHKRFKGVKETSLGIGWHPQNWYVPTGQQKHQQ